jgi:PadR family transcriptional regulator PadR
LAYEHLRSSLTKGNLWLYVLAELEAGDATPGELRTKVEEKHGFAPAAITFYSVVYRLRREGLVRRTSDSFRSAYAITPQGKAELAKAVEYIDAVRQGLRAG